jgi:hypothetical protein
MQTMCSGRGSERFAVGWRYVRRWGKRKWPTHAGYDDYGLFAIWCLHDHTSGRQPHALRARTRWRALSGSACRTNRR